MTLIPYDKKKLGIIYNKTKNLELLEEFLNSDYDCVRVNGYTHKTADCCAKCLRGSIKRFGLKGISVITRKNEVFLIKNI